MKAGSMGRAKRTSGYLILSVIFVLLVNLTLGFTAVSILAGVAILSKTENWTW